MNSRAKAFGTQHHGCRETKLEYAHEARVAGSRVPEAAAQHKRASLRSACDRLLRSLGLAFPTHPHLA